MKKTDNPTIKDLFIASCGWCEKFKQNMGSLSDKKTTTAQKDPWYIFDCGYMMHIHRIQKQFNSHDANIIAIEKSVWNNMVSNNTVEKIGSKEVPMILTGHNKVCVSVCLNETADRTILKFFVVFKGATHDSKALHEEFHRQLASSAKGWMNEELVLLGVTKFWVNFPYVNVC